MNQRYTHTHVCPRAHQWIEGPAEEQQYVEMFLSKPVRARRFVGAQGPRVVWLCADVYRCRQMYTGIGKHEIAVTVWGYVDVRVVGTYLLRRHLLRHARRLPGDGSLLVRLLGGGALLLTRSLCVHHENGTRSDKGSHVPGSARLPSRCAS